MNIKLGCRRRDTLWRLNVGILNNKLVVEQIKDEIQKYLEENNNDNTDPAILWDALKAVIRGKLISITSNLKKVKETQYNNLTTDLKQLEQKHKEKSDRKTQKQIKEVRNQINNLLHQDMEIKARYLKQNDYELGPKATKLLARRLRKQQAAITVNKLHDPKTNQPKYEPKEIENIFRDYYKDLYMQTSTTNHMRTKSFLDSLDLPSIGKVQNERITAKITIDEIHKAIGKLKTNKAPGSDGFPSEWYNKLEKELSPLLLGAFHWIMSKEDTLPSWKEAIITVIPKPLKDKEFCQNDRPISILNVDYKLYTTILSNRLQTIVPDLIDEDQTGFVSGRQTHDNIRRTLHIIHRIQQK